MIKQGIYVFDFDDALVELAPLMYSAIRKNWRKYDEFLLDFGPLNSREIYSRPEFNLDEWMLKPEFKENLTEDGLKILKSKIFYNFIEDFFNTDIYKYTKPTLLARKTLMNPLFIENSKVQKVVILSRNITETQAKSKEEFIKKYFNHSKIQLIDVKRNEIKSETLKNNGINWDIIIDDEIKNIQDFAENFDLDEKEFLIPEFGYNKMPEILKTLIIGKKGHYTFYDPFIENEIEK